MRFSAVTVSMLASSAAAWRWGGNGFTPERITQVVTITAPVATEVATPAAATTFITKVSTTTPAVDDESVVSTPSSTPSSTSSSSSGSLTTDEQNALDAQNSARSDVGTSALTWDDDLAADAQTWATHLASIGSLTHSSVSDQGENLYMQSNTDTPYLNAVNAWLDEKSSYSGEAITDTNYMTFGHYTQIVWKDTTKVGMAVASGSSGTYVVARYSPPGNYIGETAY